MSTSAENSQQLLKLDLGCGSCKKEGTIGLDILDTPGVDYVLNFEKDPLPFSDRSVGYVYSSHCLEHIANPIHIFAQISRVCADGARLEFWTPYAWENSAFIIDHKMFYNEDHYSHICLWYVDFWERTLNARWLLNEITYIIEPNILIELYDNKINLDFAIRYYKGIVKEFCVSIEVRHNYQGNIPNYKRTFAVNRYAQRYPIQTTSVQQVDDVKLQNAIEWFSSLHNSLPDKFEQLPIQLEADKADLQQTLIQLEQTQQMIQAMQSSKFWKMRTAWFKLKQAFGFKAES